MSIIVQSLVALHSKIHNNSVEIQYNKKKNNYNFALSLDIDSSNEMAAATLFYCAVSMKFLIFEILNCISSSVIENHKIR